MTGTAPDTAQHQTRNTTGHGTAPEKGGTKATREKQNLLLLGDLHAKNKKSQKKFVDMEKSTTFAEETTKSKQYENTNVKNLQK